MFFSINPQETPAGAGAVGKIEQVLSGPKAGRALAKAEEQFNSLAKMVRESPVVADSVPNGDSLFKTMLARAEAWRVVKSDAPDLGTGQRVNYVASVLKGSGVPWNQWFTPDGHRQVLTELAGLVYGHGEESTGPSLSERIQAHWKAMEPLAVEMREAIAQSKVLQETPVAAALAQHRVLAQNRPFGDGSALVGRLAFLQTLKQSGTLNPTLGLLGGDSAAGLINTTGLKALSPQPVDTMSQFGAAIAAMPDGLGTAGVMYHAIWFGAQRAVGQISETLRDAGIRGQNADALASRIAFMSRFTMPLLASSAGVTYNTAAAAVKVLTHTRFAAYGNLAKAVPETPDGVKTYESPFAVELDHNINYDMIAPSIGDDEALMGESESKVAKPEPLPEASVRRSAVQKR